MKNKNDTLQIMLVEDSKSDAALLKEHIFLIGNNVSLKAAGSLAEAFEYIRNNHIDAILLDLSLPDSSGTETVERTRKAFPYLPIVALTGVEDETIGIQAVRMGAGDYLVKGHVDGRVIMRAIRYSVERKAIEKSLYEANIEQKEQNIKLLQSQTLLEESKRNYRDLFDFAPIGYFVIDNKGIIVDVNSTGTAMLGVEKTNLLGTLLANCVCDDDKDILFSNGKHVFDAGTCRQCVLRFCKNGSTQFYAELKIDPVMDANQKVVQSRIAMIDVTERKKNEQVAQKALERFKILSESAGKLLESKKPQQLINELCTKIMKFLNCQFFFNYLVDDEKKCLHLNTCAGVSEQVAKNLEWLEYGQAVCGLAAKEGNRIIAENIPEKKEHHTQTVESLGIKAYVCHPFKVQGKVIGTISFGTNARLAFDEEEIQVMKVVSDQIATAMERLKFENALYQSEQINHAQANRLKTILEAAPAIIWIANDRQCKTITGNREAYEVSRVRPGENISKTEPFPDKLNHYKFVKDGFETKPENLPIYAVASTGKPVINDNIEIVYDDNTSRRLFGNIVPLFDDNENPDGAIAVFIDITELKKTEEELHLSRLQLQHVNSMLESRVKERTGQLEKLIEVLQKEIVERVKVEKQLTENQKKLRSLSSEIIFVEERERRQVATQLHDSIGQLLAFSKKELGALVDSVPHDVQPLLKEVWEMIKQAVEQTRTLTFDLSPAALYTLGLEAALEELGEDFSKKGKFKFNFMTDNHEFPLPEQDKVLLYRSVRELMINIVKHSQANNVDVIITKTDDKVQITIKDDGVGFNVKKVSKKGKVGFGLFSIKERLEAIGGNIKIKSAPGKGTIVILTAPLNKVKQRKRVE